jgi:hypothetical protein
MPAAASDAGRARQRMGGIHDGFRTSRQGRRTAQVLLHTAQFFGGLTCSEITNSPAQPPAERDATRLAIVRLLLSIELAHKDNSLRRQVQTCLLDYAKRRRMTTP